MEIVISNSGALQGTLNSASDLRLVQSYLVFIVWPDGTYGTYGPTIEGVVMNVHGRDLGPKGWGGGADVGRDADSDTLHKTSKLSPFRGQTRERPLLGLRPVVFKAMFYFCLSTPPGAVVMGGSDGHFLFESGRGGPARGALYVFFGLGLTLGGPLATT